MYSICIGILSSRTIMVRSWRRIIGVGRVNSISFVIDIVWILRRRKTFLSKIGLDWISSIHSCASIVFALHFGESFSRILTVTIVSRFIILSQSWSFLLIVIRSFIKSYSSGTSFWNRFSWSVSLSTSFRSTSIGFIAHMSLMIWSSFSVVTILESLH